MDKVIEQFNRVKRWYERFEEISKGKEHDRESDYYEDIVYAFFQNCFYLKDWIINSGVLNKNTVNKFISLNKDMRICRDLCNGSKHLIINNPSIDKDISMNEHKYYILIGSGVPEKKFDYLIHSNGLVINAFDLATNCVLLWKIFLRDKKILK
jgi:hypothetical protein